jgi:uncharacterized membrane protein
MMRISVCIRKATLVVLLCYACIQAAAQNVPNYFFTDKSERYFSNSEMEAAINECLRQLFVNNKIPYSVFERKYSELRNKLLPVAKPLITARFKQVEAGNKLSVNAATGSSEFEAIKVLYEDALTGAIRTACQRSELRSYFTFAHSDRITFFNSHVTIQPDGKLRVKESISIYNGDGSYTTTSDPAVVQAGGSNNEIKRGIVRTFPTVYEGKYHLLSTTTFKVISVKRLGEPDEQWELKRHKNGYQLYIGVPSQFLRNGNYTYEIEYETAHQIAYTDNYDELNWNVTGNGWNFRIDSAACTIVLPAGASLVSNACYTGPQGSKERECSFTVDRTTGQPTVLFATTRPLSPYEGLTTGTSFRKGAVAAISPNDIYIKRIKDNLAIFLMPMLALLIALYNFIAWWRVGRDPDAGTIIPEFYPPANLSPAATGYVYRQGFDNKLVAATITDWAVRKRIQIDVEREGLIFKSNSYNIKAGTGTTKRAGYEDFSNEADGIIGTTISKGKYNSSLASLKKTIESSLDSRYKGTGRNPLKGLFVLNNMYMAPGNLLITAGIAFVIFGLFTRQGLFNIWHLVYFAAGIILCIIVQTIYYRLIRRYTDEGRKVMNQVEGFRMFLKAADEDRINAMNPPEKTIDLYEAYLPFAIALDCEIEWGQQFKDIIDSASIDPDKGGTGTYQYNSRHYSSSFSSSFASSFSGTISSASTPPSSSGGSGGSFGGGSSGGGGGGGGGGGW